MELLELGPLVGEDQVGDQIPNKVWQDHQVLVKAPTQVLEQARVVPIQEKIVLEVLVYNLEVEGGSEILFHVQHHLDQVPLV